jgi:Cu/Ag efflux protein CusF
MKLKMLIIMLSIAMSFACEQKTATNNTSKASTANAATPLPSTSPAPTPKDGDYDGKGVVTKINLELGSVEVNHKEIKDLMPAMTMEFFVSDKKLLDGLKVGDEVDFVIRYKDPNYTNVKITMTKLPRTRNANTTNS